MARQLAPYTVRILPSIPEEVAGGAVTQSAQLYACSCSTSQVLYREIYHLRQQLTIQEGESVALRERCRRLGVENDGLRRDAGQLGRQVTSLDQNQRLLEEIVRRSSPVGDRVVRAIAVTDLERAESARKITKLEEELDQVRKKAAGDQRRVDEALEIARDRSRRRIPRPLRRLEPRTIELQEQGADALANPPASA